MQSKDVPCARAIAHVESLIASKARSLIRSGIDYHGIEDLRQESSLAILKVMPKFNPSRGTVEALATTVVESTLKMHYRGKRAQKRRGGKPDESLSDCGGELSVLDKARRLGLDPTDSADRATKSAELHAALATLPPRLSEVARMLPRMSVRAIAASTGRSRRDVNRDIDAIRAHLLRNGIDGDF